MGETHFKTLELLPPPCDMCRDIDGGRPPLFESVSIGRNDDDIHVGPYWKPDVVLPSQYPGDDQLLFVLVGADPGDGDLSRSVRLQSEHAGIDEINAISRTAGDSRCGGKES